MAHCKVPRKVGQEVRVEAHGEVAVLKKLRHDYFLKVEGKERGRFGNARQICEDVKFFRETGVLPQSKTSWH